MIVRPSVVLVDPNADAGGYGPISVKTCGAKGDGVTDDTAAIQAAITAAPDITALPSGCTYIYFPPGAYKISSALVVTSRRVVLFGDGMNGAYGTRIEQTNPNANIVEFQSDMCSCYGLFFKGTGWYPLSAGTGNGLVLGTGPGGYTMSSMSVNNCAFFLIPRKVILASYCDSIFVNNCQFELSGGGIDFVNQANVTSPPSYLLGNLQGSEIEGNLFSALYDGAITIQNPGGGYNQIVGNSFWLCGQPLDSTRAAIRVANSTSPETRNTLISSNKFRGNIQDILVVGPTTIGTSGVTNVNVIGNTSDQALLRSMLFDGVGNLMLVGNQVHDANQYPAGALPAIEVKGTSVGVMISGNKVSYSATDAQTYGLTLGASVSNVVYGINEFSGKTGNVNYVAGVSFKTTPGSPRSWTPVVYGSGTAGTPTYSLQSGQYVVQGDLCYVSGKVVLTAKTGIAGEVRISGLPIVSYGVASLSVGNVIQGGAAGYTIAAKIESGTSTIILVLCKQDSSSGTAALADGNIGNDFRIEFSGVIMM